MNFPVGTIITSAPLPIDFSTVAQEFQKINFNGYIIQSVSGNCIEEGAIFFKNGEIIACIVECLSLKQIFKGNSATDYFFNQTKGVGYFQAVELSKSQVDLVTAFDEKIILTSKISLKDLPKLIPDSFKSNFEFGEQKNDVFGDLGLSDLKRN